MIDVTEFAVIIIVALAITSLAPIILLWQLVKDWKKGDIW